MVLSGLFFDKLHSLVSVKCLLGNWILATLQNMSQTHFLNTEREREREREREQVRERGEGEGGGGRSFGES